MENLKVVMIGAGNVATHLSKTLIDKGIQILQIYSKSELSAKSLADQHQIPYTFKQDEITSDADIYFYTIKDDILPDFVANDFAIDKIHIHTAGSISIDVFKTHKKYFGVLYPLQTFSKNKDINFSEVPLFIESSSIDVEQKIQYISRKISDKIFFISSEQRLSLHISAVFACNFVNYMYFLANHLVEKSGLDFEVLKPLILETADKIKYLHPEEAQTGPAKRFDKMVIDKHLEQLICQEDLSKIYKLLSENIFKSFQKNNDEEENK